MISCQELLYSAAPDLLSIRCLLAEDMPSWIVQWKRKTLLSQSFVMQLGNAKISCRRRSKVWQPSWNSPRLESENSSGLHRTCRKTKPVWLKGINLGTVDQGIQGSRSPQSQPEWLVRFSQIQWQSSEVVGNPPQLLSFTACVMLKSMWGVLNHWQNFTALLLGRKLHWGWWWWVVSAEKPAKLGDWLIEWVTQSFWKTAVMPWDYRNPGQNVSDSSMSLLSSRMVPSQLHNLLKLKSWYKWYHDRKLADGLSLSKNYMIVLHSHIPVI